MKYRLAAILLTFFATVRVAADLLDQPAISAGAAVTNLAPAMKVFTAHEGYETYSASFTLNVGFSDGEKVTLPLNQATYAGLRGPYNRRNVYGALIAYGPVLVANPQTRPMWQAMARRGFCGKHSVVAELGLDNSSGVSHASIDFLNQVSRESDYATTLEVHCE